MMTLRKIIPIAAVLVLAAFLIFFLTRPKDAASAREDKILGQLSSQFDTTANISYNGFNATATISQQTPLSCQVVFSEPESLKDMAFSFAQDKVEVAYKGLAFSFDPSSVPGSAVAKMAVSAINKVLGKEGVQVNYTEDALEVSGETEAGAFTLLLDPENGNMMKLSIPGEQLEIEFENFTFLG